MVFNDRQLFGPEWVLGREKLPAQKKFEEYLEVW